MLGHYLIVSIFLIVVGSFTDASAAVSGIDLDAPKPKGMAASPEKIVDRVATLEGVELVEALKKYRLKSLIQLVSRHDGLLTYNYELELALNTALVEHSADWAERAAVFKDLKLNQGALEGMRYGGPNYLDALLGFDSYRLEKERKFKGAHEVWSSHQELRKEFSQIVPDRPFLVQDLGAGAGRVGMVLLVEHPEARFVGFEANESRVEAANAWAKRFGLEERFKMVQQDLRDPEFQLPKADLIHLYQTFTEENFKVVYRKIENLAARTQGGIQVLTKKLWDPLNESLHGVKVERKKLGNSKLALSQLWQVKVEQ